MGVRTQAARWGLAMPVFYYVLFFLLLRLASHGVSALLKKASVRAREMPACFAAAAAAAAATRATDEADAEERAWSASLVRWHPHESGSRLEPLLRVDETLGDSPVALVDARFLIALSKRNGRLDRRQGLPAEAFIDLASLRRMPAGGRFGDSLRVLCVSYPWLQPDHPDPQGTTLALLAAALEKFVNYTHKTSLRPCTYAVFLDFASLFQKDGAGERTGREALLFGRALAGLSELYSHPRTFILKITSLPEGYPIGFIFPKNVTANVAEYDDRGWCFCEAAMANLVKSSNKVVDLGKFSGSPVVVKTSSGTEHRADLVGLLEECKAGRRPPLSPAAFTELLETKSFTSKKADLDTVAGLYAAAFERQMSEAVQLFYRGLGWGNAEVGVLAQALRVAQALELLNLDGNAIGDAGAAALASALHEGTAPALKTIKLKGNPVASSPLSLEALTRAREGLEVEAGARSEGARGPMAEAAPHPAPRSPVSGQGGLACCLRCVRKSPQMQRLD